MSTDVYTLITDRIISLLDKGTVPWQQTWSTEVGMPRNLVTEREYHGSNLWILGSQGYTSPFWATLHQVNQAGGRILSGSKSTPIIFYKPYKSIDKETGEEKTRRVLQYSNVFNAAQMEGVDVPEIVKEVREHTPIEVCDKIIGGYPKGPTIIHGDSRAYYRPSSDSVHMPELSAFTTAEAYYSTLFHELTHSTGHSSRLDRNMSGMVRFGDVSYAREELIAEMGATYLCGVAGISNSTIDNSASYIASWKQALRNDPRCVITAAGKAQRAADYILDKPAYSGE
jgi:antirestriction protein ArdC